MPTFWIWESFVIDSLKNEVFGHLDYGFRVFEPLIIKRLQFMKKQIKLLLEAQWRLEILKGSFLTYEKVKAWEDNNLFQFCIVSAD